MNNYSMTLRGVDLESFATLVDSGKLRIGDGSTMSQNGDGYHVSLTAKDLTRLLWLLMEQEFDEDMESLASAIGETLGIEEMWLTINNSFVYKLYGSKGYDVAGKDNHEWVADLLNGD